MIKPEIPKPTHIYKDEIGKKKGFVTDGLVANATWCDEANMLFTRECAIPYLRRFSRLNKLLAEEFNSGLSVKIVFDGGIIKFDK